MDKQLTTFGIYARLQREADVNPPGDTGWIGQARFQANSID
jgi:hypothetical protein